eukprot:5199337-Pleurochrysis_carterae.AAC.1
MGSCERQRSCGGGDRPRAHRERADGCSVSTSIQKCRSDPVGHSMRADVAHVASASAVKSLSTLSKMGETHLRLSRGKRVATGNAPARDSR